MSDLVEMLGTKLSSPAKAVHAITPEYHSSPKLYSLLFAQMTHYNVYVLVLTADCVTSGRLPDLPFPVCNVGSSEVRCA